MCPRILPGTQGLQATGPVRGQSAGEKGRRRIETSHARRATTIRLAASPGSPRFLRNKPLTLVRGDKCRTPLPQRGLLLRSGKKNARCADKSFISGSLAEGCHARSISEVQLGHATLCGAHGGHAGAGFSAPRRDIFDAETPSARPSVGPATRLAGSRTGQRSRRTALAGTRTRHRSTPLMRPDRGLRKTPGAGGQVIARPTSGSFQ